MTSILLVDKTGTIKAFKAKDLTIDTLYKKAGFKSPEGFQRQATWPISAGNDTYSISVYGKSKGKAGLENKYDFPPPIDTTLLFGSCVIVNQNKEGKFLDLSVDDWEKVYEYLFGGFEDLGTDDSTEYDTEEELERMKGQTTKDGYLKDGFIVSDEDEEEEEEVPVVQKAKKSASKPKKSKPVEEPVATEEDSLDCTEELQEEEYV